jgi:hypothetical protein
MPYKRTIFQVLACVAITLICFVVCAPMANHYLLTGRLFPVDIIETLESPVAVITWGTTGLVLADGSTVPLPGIDALPAESDVLTQTTARGVEITPDGRVIGLVRIHHWCGNDPVREHLIRVDIADLLAYRQYTEAGAALHRINER